MHVRVVELMVAGVRRPREECLADPGTIGTLSIGDIPIGTAEKRPLHAAQLWERWGTSARRGLLPPLFDVQVLRITLNRPGFCRQLRASYFLSNRSPYEQSTLPRRIQDRGGQTNP